jgi:hypothetical protein
MGRPERDPGIDTEMPLVRSRLRSDRKQRRIFACWPSPTAPGPGGRVQRLPRIPNR